MKVVYPSFLLSFFFCEVLSCSRHFRSKSITVSFSFFGFFFFFLHRRRPSAFAVDRAAGPESFSLHLSLFLSDYSTMTASNGADDDDKLASSNERRPFVVALGTSGTKRARAFDSATGKPIAAPSGARIKFLLAAEAARLEVNWGRGGRGRDFDRLDRPSILLTTS